jgi:flagellar motor protein MotB
MGEGMMSSVGDLMSAVLFIFIILVVHYAIEQKKATDDMKNAINDAAQERTKLINSIADELRKNGVEVDVEAADGIVRLRDSISFDKASDLLGARQRETVATIAQVLSEKLPPYAYGGDKSLALDAVLVEGHTDSQPLGDGGRFRNNMELSTARAVRVFEAMMEAQPALKDMLNRDSLFLFSASGYGENRPWKPNSTEEYRRMNRRIDLRLVMAPGRRESAGKPDTSSVVQ